MKTQNYVVSIVFNLESNFNPDFAHDVRPKTERIYWQSKFVGKAERLFQTRDISSQKYYTCVIKNGWKFLHAKRKSGS